jgi:hypothetical protein
VIWLGTAWLGVAIWLTAPEFLTLVKFFRHPGEQYYRALLVSLGAAPVLFAAWHWLHRRIWRQDPALLTALPVALATLYEPRATAVALLVLVACHATGSRVRKRLGIAAAGAAEKLVVNLAIGFGALLCSLFGLGLCGLYHAWVFAILLLAPAVLGWRETAELGETWRAIRVGWGATTEAATAAGSLLVAFAMLFEVCAVFAALLPNIAFDVLKMHLPSAQYYAAQHALRPVPALDYSYLPQGVETVMTLGLVLAGQPAAQLLAALFFPLTILAVWSVLRACAVGRMAAFAGCVCAVSAPAFHWTASVAKNDIALAFFCLTALLGYLRWRAAGGFRWIEWGTFCVAMAAGIKHSVLFALPGVGLLYAQAVWRERSRVRALLSLATIFVTLGLFWHARAAYLTGNPLYPLPASLAAGTGKDLKVTDGQIAGLLRRPWDVHFHGDLYFESMLHAPLGIVMLVAAPVWFGRGWNYRAGAGACLLFAVLGLVYWYYSIQVIRYPAAAFLVLLSLSGAGAWKCYESAPLAGRIPIFAAAAYTLLFSLCGTAILEVNGPALRYLARRIDKNGYLREALGTYASLEFLRGWWQPGDSVLAVGNWSTAYSPDAQRFHSLGEEADAPKIATELHERQSRFLILPNSRSDDGEAVGGRELHRDANFTVYLVEPADRPR